MILPPSLVLGVRPLLIGHTMEGGTVWPALLPAGLDTGCLRLFMLPVVVGHKLGAPIMATADFIDPTPPRVRSVRRC